VGVSLAVCCALRDRRNTRRYSHRGCARQLPNDWQQRYGYRPALLETFVETQRHRGTCYKAANWTCIGQTAGRGKKSTSHEQLIAVKDIWMYPPRKNFAAVLCQ
jgi:hypothetical protein